LAAKIGPGDIFCAVPIFAGEDDKKRSKPTLVDKRQIFMRTISSLWLWFYEPCMLENTSIAKNLEVGFRNMISVAVSIHPGSGSAPHHGFAMV